MKTSGRVVLAAAFLWALVSVQAQQQLQTAEAEAAEELVVNQWLTEAFGKPLAIESVPQSGTFWLLQKGGLDGKYPPYPFNPFANADVDLPVYAVGTNRQFLVDDRIVDYQALEDQELVERMTAQALGLSEASSFGGMAQMSMMSFTDGLWLEMVSAQPPDNGTANLILHGTTNDIAYEILSREDLPGPSWFSETIILGAENQDWTPFSVLENNRTNAFFWARSLVDEDGNGIPDYWESENGVTDSYGDADGDGWNNLQEFQNGTNPNVFNTPPAPSGLSFVYSNDAVIVSWNPSSGNVTGYTLDVYDPVANQTQSFNLSANQTTFVDANPPQSSTTFPYFGWYPTTPNYNPPHYKVTATYGTSGSSQMTVNLVLTNSLVDGMIVRGKQGHPQLVVSAIPQNAAAIRLAQARQFFANSTFLVAISNLVDIPISEFTNGIFNLPADWIPTNLSQLRWYVEIVDVNGRNGEATLVIDGDGLNFARVPFYDGREQLKQNLAFLLRAAGLDYPFGFSWHCRFWRQYLIYDTTYFTSYFYPTDYLYAGLFDDGDLNEFQPFVDNHLFRNFVASPSVLDAYGFLKTGVVGGSSYPTLKYPSTNLFVVPTNEISLSAVLPTNEVQWIYFDQYSDDLPLVFEDDGQGHYSYTMLPNFRNAFGLPYLSIKTAYSYFNLETSTLHPGDSVPVYEETPLYFYPETAHPQLQTVDYYFGRAYNRIGTVSFTDPLPGQSGFSPTNPTPLMIVPFGFSYNLQDSHRYPPTTIAGYAKQAILNGYTNVFAYLQLYFDKAYLCDDNGNVTTNETGVLSPYGEFVPTMPGTVAMVTMPENADNTGPRGTNIVHVIKLQLDVNHDGEMDLSLAGPDNTTKDRPFTFWVNGDWEPYGEELNVIGAHDYTRNTITSIRDLEDFSRLWICGVPALSSADGYAVTLNWRNTGGTNPKIKIFPSAETDGGISYLTNGLVALNQLTILVGQPSPGQMLGEVSSAQSLTFPADYFAGARKYFLFEGSGIGQGELVLTISKDGNTIAETSTWMDLHDVKDLYQRAVATPSDIFAPPYSQSGSPNYTNNVFDESVLGYLNGGTFQKPADESSQCVVFVHGWNMTYCEYVGFSETMFKRLWWQGYHGRFATFRWATLTSYNSYNTSEFRAWKYGLSLKKYVEALKASLPGYSMNVVAHSMGNIVTGSALQRGLTIDNYVLMQAAIPAGCYDTSSGINSYAPFTAAEVSKATPDGTANLGYRGYLTNVTGNLVNFYNTNDFALATGNVGTLAHIPFLWWIAANWEANEVDYKPDSFGNIYYDYDPGQSASQSGQFWIPGAGPGGHVIDRYINNAHEMMSFIARPRSKAVGARGGIGGAIGSEVDLNLNFGFDRNRDEHSAEFNWNIQRVGGKTDSFYSTLFEVVR